jgi:RimJ/RimL family protein N-acetyltransferase
MLSNQIMLNNEIIKLEKLNVKDKLFYRDIYTNPELMRYVCQPFNNDTADKYFNIALKRMATTPVKSLIYVIKPLISETKVGITSLRWNQKNHDCVEIGAMILKEYQRKKYAHMAKNLLIKHAVHKFNVRQVVAICEKQNYAANQANRKLGFKLEKEFIDENDKITKIKWIINN